MLKFLVLFTTLVTACNSSLLKLDADNLDPLYLDLLLMEKRYAEFEKLMDIHIPNLSQPEYNETYDDESSLHVQLFHGDILLTSRQIEAGRQGKRFKLFPLKKWNKTIPYYISSGYDNANRIRIEMGIKTFNQLAADCVKWTPRIDEPDFVFIFPGRGCYSTLGKAGGRQALSLNTHRCLRKGTILHEMNHVIGMLHEHNRPDRDKYILVLWGNIDVAWWRQYRKVSAKDYEILGPYDYYSVMHYAIRYRRITNRKPGFYVYNQRANTSRIGQRDGFTRTDIQKIRRLYCGIKNEK